MRRTSNLAILSVVFSFTWAAAAQAQQAPPKEDAPAASQPAPAETAPADPAAQPTPAKPAKAEPEAAKETSAEPTRLDSAAIAEWAKKLRARAEDEGPWLTVGDLCEVKHYKQEKLQGFGLVVDLEDVVRQEEKSEDLEISSVLRSTRAPSTRLSDVLAILNTTVAEGDVTAKISTLFQPDQLVLAAVTATVPPEGVRQGDRIDCEVRALGGKSITDGFLLPARLAPPGPQMEAPAAIAAGPVAKESSYRSGPAQVASGCLVQADVCDEFVKDDKISLILDEEHAEFPVAQDVVNLINTEMGVAMNQPLAKALNRRIVEVTVPESFADDPVAFVTLVLRLETQIPAPEEEPEEPTSRFRTRGGLE